MCGSTSKYPEDASVNNTTDDEIDPERPSAMKAMYST